MPEAQSQIESKERIKAGKILVFGGSSMVGSRLLELFDGDFATSRSTELDKRNYSQLKEFLRKEAPDLVVDFSAFAAVSKAQDQKGMEDGECWQTNVVGTRNLIEALPTKTRLVYISTDYVFPGSVDNPGPYSENHELETDRDKLTWYGWTKAEAERIIGNRGVIARISSPVRAKFNPKADFLRNFLHLYDKGNLKSLFANQYISVSYIDEVCLALKAIIDRDLSGIFHFSSPDTTSPYDITTYMLEQLGKDVSGVERSSVDPNRYPQYGGLSVEATQTRLGIQFSSSRKIVDKLIEQGIATS